MNRLFWIASIYAIDYEQALFKAANEFFLAAPPYLRAHMLFPLRSIVRFLARPLIYSLARVHILHKLAAPAGPYLVVCNHISHFDPGVLLALFPRPIDFMSMRELFRRWLPRLFFSSCGAFPVDRSKVDSQAVREAVRRLEAGHIVGIFPEGGIRTGEASLVEGASTGLGAVALAQMAQVNIQVCLMIGTDQFYNWRNFFCRPHLYLIYGPILSLAPSLPTKAARAKLLQDMQDAFRCLYQEFLREAKPTVNVLPQSYEERKRRKKNQTITPNTL